MAKVYACEKCQRVEMNGPSCPECGGVMQSRVITQKWYERIFYGGLTKKQHDRMMALANETNSQFRARRISETK